MANKPDEDENRKTGFAYAAGLTLFAAVASFCALGWMLDKWLGTSPWMFFLFFVLGLAAGVLNVYRTAGRFLK